LVSRAANGEYKKKGGGGPMGRRSVLAKRRKRERRNKGGPDCMKRGRSKKFADKAFGQSSEGKRK